MADIIKANFSRGAEQALGNLAVEMLPPGPEHIVLAFGVGEVVQRNAELDALLCKAEGVLPNHGGVYSSLTDKEFALEIAGFCDE